MSKSQIMVGSKSKTDERANETVSYAKASTQAEVKPAVKSQPPRNTEKKAIGKVSSLKREQTDIFKSFSKPKPGLPKENIGSSAATSSAISTAHSVRHPSSV